MNAEQIWLWFATGWVLMDVAQLIAKALRRP